jgi:hypothetical protein
MRTMSPGTPWRRSSKAIVACVIVASAVSPGAGLPRPFDELRVAPSIVEGRASAAGRGVDLEMDRTAIGEALSLGQSRIDRDRVRFHEPYRTIVGKPPLDYIDFITPFRRVVLAAESRMRAGDRSFGQRQALELAAAADNELDVVVEFSFHPLNNYVGVPDYRLRLERGPGGVATLPRSSERVPRYGVRVDGVPPSAPAPGAVAPGKSQPLLGGTLIAHFAGRRLDAAGVYDVVVEEAGKELGRVRADFGRLR